MDRLPAAIPGLPSVPKLAFMDAEHTNPPHRVNLDPQILRTAPFFELSRHYRPQLDHGVIGMSRLAGANDDAVLVERKRWGVEEAHLTDLGVERIHPQRPRPHACRSRARHLEPTLSVSPGQAEHPRAAALREPVGMGENRWSSWTLPGGRGRPRGRALSCKADTRT